MLDNLINEARAIGATMAFKKKAAPDSYTVVDITADGYDIIATANRKALDMIIEGALRNRKLTHTGFYNVYDMDDNRFVAGDLYLLTLDQNKLLAR